MDILFPVKEYPEAFGWTIQEQIERRGYLFEEHLITTEDGYILKAFRIPGRAYKKKDNASEAYSETDLNGSDESGIR